MSYILDALKKAEAERNPGSNPNANAHAGPKAEFSALPPLSAHAPRTTPWVWIGMSSAALAIAALAWLKPWQPSPAQVVVLASSPAPAAPVAPALTVAAPPPAQTPQPVPASPPVAAAPVEAAAPPAPRTSKQEAPPAAAKPESRKAAAAKPPAEKKPPKAQASEPASAKEAKPKPAPAPAPASENRIGSLQELPAHIQNEIPRLSVTGYIYSPNKADRTVLINTRLLREGEQVAPGLMLEQLTPSGMVLSYKGYRYRTSY